MSTVILKDSLFQLACRYSPVFRIPCGEQKAKGHVLLKTEDTPDTSNPPLWNISIPQ